MTSDEGSAAPQAPRVRLHAALLSLYVTLVAWAFYEQATAWPHVGHWSYVAYFLLCPGIVFQAYSLAYAWHAGSEPARRWLARLVTVPLGLVFAAALVTWAGALSLRGFGDAYAPFIARLGADLSDPCRGAAGHFQLPTVVAYNRRAERDRPIAKLHHDASHFVLAFRGGSIDIDGSTFYYDSRMSNWHRFHNDDEVGRDNYNKLTAGLAECLLQGTGSN